MAVPLEFILAAAENGYTIIQTAHYVHFLILLQCVNTEIQPVITELMIG